jgi:hypothetical protein
MLERLPGGVFLSNLWPVFFGAGIGDVVATSAEWTRPGLIAVMSGAIVQLFIHFMRNSFAERNDTMNALKDLLREQRLAAQQVDRTARRVRHELANRANRAELKATLLEEGVPLESVRARLDRMKPLYDLDAEDKAEEELIQQTEAGGARDGER